MQELDPNALAECGDSELDERGEVQPVDEGMILSYVLKTRKLPEVSARPFARWLDSEWNEFNDGTFTNGAIIDGALGFWRGK